MRVRLLQAHACQPLRVKAIDSDVLFYTRAHFLGAQIEMNGVAGIHITGSNNFTFEGPRGYDSGSSGQAYVGKSEGLQPVQVVIDSSTLVTFTDIGVFSDFGEETTGHVEYRE